MFTNVFAKFRCLFLKNFLHLRLDFFQYSLIHLSSRFFVGFIHDGSKLFQTSFARCLFVGKQSLILVEVFRPRQFVICRQHAVKYIPYIVIDSHALHLKLPIELLHPKFYLVEYIHQSKRRRLALQHIRLKGISNLLILRFGQRLALFCSNELPQGLQVFGYPFRGIATSHSIFHEPCPMMSHFMSQRSIIAILIALNYSLSHFNRHKAIFLGKFCTWNPLCQSSSLLLIIGRILYFQIDKIRFCWYTRRQIKGTDRP